MNNILVAILGIGKYDSGLDDLPGVEKDYQNTINTFVKYWNYKVLYKTSNDDVDHSSLIYTNNKDIVSNRTNYTLYWTNDDIQLFVEQVRKTIVKNKHDGLLLVLSSHGDSDKVIYDSKLEIFELQYLFSMFSPEWSSLLESYKGTKQESNHLFKIPKIFCIDSCRGSLKAKLTNICNDQENDILYDR